MRHGARYPTVNIKADILASLAKLERLPQGIYHPNPQSLNQSQDGASVSEYIRWINDTWTPGHLTDVGKYE